MVAVREHTRGGTTVRAHSRWAAGGRREMTILAVFALVVLGASGGGLSGEGTGGGSKGARVEQPRTTGDYPVKFEGWKKPKPTVSYPVKFDRPD